MKHARRILSVLLTLTMVLSLMPAMGSAARAATEVNSWASLQEALNGASESESAPTAIKLTDNLKAGQSDASLTVPGGKYVTLDLAGHTIDRGLYDPRKTEEQNEAAATDDGYVLRIAGSLTLTDSSATAQNPVGAGRLTGGNNSSTMYCGGGVYVVGGTFTMQGGSIAGNASSDGGGVYVWNSGTFRMEGGSISGNSAHSGGGVCAGNGSVFTMTGGTVCGNRSLGSGDGGGVHVNKGTFTLGGTAEIRDNVAGGNAGGVRVYESEFTMTGGTISGNASGYLGGGVCVVGGSTFSMSGGSIERCTTVNYGSGVYVAGKNSTFSMSGGMVSGNSYTDLGGFGGVYVTEGGVFKASGGATVTDNTFAETGDADNVYLYQRGNGDDKPYVHVTGKLTGAIGVDASFTGVIAQGDDGYTMTEADATRLILDKTDKKLAFGSDTLSVSEPVTDWSLLQKMIDDAADGATITLDRDYTAASYNEALEVRKELTIDLAGHTLRGTIGDSVLYVYCSGKTLTVTDTVGGGTITGGYCDDGGGVFLSEGSFRLEGGTITGNRAVDDGGGVCVAGDTTFILAGGSITGNRAGHGGGIYTDCGTVRLEGGSISGNVADKNGGGVYVEDQDNNNHFFVSGAPTVLGNTVDGAANNVCLGPDGGAIRIPAPLTGAIGVSVETEDPLAGKAVARKFDYTITASDVLQLYSDNSDYVPRLKGEEVRLEEVTKASDWASLQEALSGTSENGPTAIKLTGDLKPGESDHALTVPSDKSVILDLGGKTIDRGLYNPQKPEAENAAAAMDGYVLKVVGTLILRDSSADHSGKLTGGNGTICGGGVYVSGGTFTMEGGAIIGNSAEHGGGVQLQNANFTMTGGTISGNRVSETGGGVDTSLQNNTIRISGSPIISGNIKSGEAGGDDTPSNMWLASVDLMGKHFEHHIEIVGGLDENARIGVGTAYAPGAFTSGLSGNGTAENFFSDDPMYGVALNTDGEAYFIRNLATGGEIHLSASSFVYDGTAKVPTVAVMLDGQALDESNYEVSIRNNVDPGTATVTVTGKGVYVGTLTKSFKIRGVTGTVSGTALTYSVTDAPEGARLLAAWYDASGRLLGVKAVAVAAGDTAGMKLSVGAGAAVYKLMLVNGTSHAPLCKEWRIAA